jgi:hypothetical protein
MFECSSLEGVSHLVDVDQIGDVFEAPSEVRGLGRPADLWPYLSVTDPRSRNAVPTHRDRLAEIGVQGLLLLDGESVLMYPLSDSVGWLEGRFVETQRE